MNGTNHIKIFLKLESLLKDEPIMHWEQNMSRSIVHTIQEFTILFCPTALQLKKRLKRCLHKNVIYGDGYTPSELSDICSNFDAMPHFYESDLNKLDRQVNEELFEIRYQLLERLGAGEHILNFYRLIHAIWKFNSKNTKGWLKWQEPTGEAFTSLGNVLYNLIINSRLIKDSLVTSRETFNQGITLVLGDDILINSKIDLKLDKYIVENRIRHNMISKLTKSEKMGVFLRLIFYAKNGKLSVGPDILRMYYKYQITNRNVEETDRKNVIENRKLSYLYMLGDNGNEMNIMKQLSIQCNILKWHDLNLTMEAISHLYKVDYNFVYNKYLLLLKLLSSDYTRKIQFHVWSQKK